MITHFIRHFSGFFFRGNYLVFGLVPVFFPILPVQFGFWKLKNWKNWKTNGPFARILRFFVPFEFRPLTGFSAFFSCRFFWIFARFELKIVFFGSFLSTKTWEIEGIALCNFLEKYGRARRFLYSKHEFFWMKLNFFFFFEKKIGEDGRIGRFFINFLFWKKNFKFIFGSLYFDRKKLFFSFFYEFFEQSSFTYFLPKNDIYKGKFLSYLFF